MTEEMLFRVRGTERSGGGDAMCPRFFGIFRSSCFVVVTIRNGADKPIKSKPSSRRRRVAVWSRLHWIIVHFIERGACHAPLHFRSAPSWTSPGGVGAEPRDTQFWIHGLTRSCG